MSDIEWGRYLSALPLLCGGEIRRGEGGREGGRGEGGREEGRGREGGRREGGREGGGKEGGRIEYAEGGTEKSCMKELGRKG